jgi:hypothetical protein
MYNVTIDTPSEQKEAGFLDAGIHTNIEMTSVEYKKNDAGSEFIAFYFVNPITGEKGSHTEWKSRANTPEELATKEMNQMSRIKQIALCFIPKEQYVFSAISFEDFARKTILAIGDTYKGVKLRTKFVYTNGKYTSLPNYWKFRFIERMDNNGNYGQELQQSTIKEMSIDKMTRTPDPVSTTQNPFTSNTENPFIS